MDVLLVGGKNYVKASVIARELGYTADYVGQLCRSRKVNAKLVGRSWYVDRESIQGHKKTRYRSTNSTTKRELTSSIRVRDDEPVSVSHFYTHHERAKQTRYLDDKSELIPDVAKHNSSKRLSIGLADAKELKVGSEIDPYTFEKPKLPKIKFAGELHVTDVVEVDAAVSGSGTVIHPHEVPVLKSEKRLKNIVISDTRTQGGDAIETTSAPTVGEDRVTSVVEKKVKIDVLETPSGSNAFDVQEGERMGARNSKTQLLIAVSTSVLGALIFLCCMLGLQTDGTYQISNTVHWTFHFSIQNILLFFHFLSDSKSA